MIFAIKRFEMHDGDGIRTTVFFKGCPLRCKWCHNPESFRGEKELMVDRNKCVKCGRCAQICDAHTLLVSDAVPEECTHIYNSEKCTHCGACVKVCPVNALSLYGYEISVEKLVEELLEDEIFYRESGGGVTLSGGEPLLQADYCRELLQALKAKGIHTAVDTCGYVDRSAIDKVLEYTDVFLFDVKAADEAVHTACTGVSNKKILENLRYIDSCGKQIEIRIPYVPGMNADQMQGIGQIIRELKNVTKVRVLKYHSLAENKYAGLGMDFPTAKVREPEDTEIDQVIRLFRDMGIHALKTDDI